MNEEKPASGPVTTATPAPPPRDHRDGQAPVPSPRDHFAERLWKHREALGDDLHAVMDAADAYADQSAIAAQQPQPAPELAADDVHVDWHMTSEEWRQLAAVLALRPDLPYVRALIDAGKVPAFGSEPTATVKPARELAAAMAETRQLRTALRTLADLWDASSDKDEETARRPNRAYLVLEERATVRRACAADIRKLAGPEGK